MLAPLRDRSILERDEGDPLAPAVDTRQIVRLESEIGALRQALRQSRQSQRRSATLAARQIVAQTNEISRLQEINAQQRQRLAQFESGQAMIELGRQLIELSDANDQLAGTAQRVWFLEKTIAAAHAEYERLSRERDALANQDRVHSQQRH